MMEFKATTLPGRTTPATCQMVAAWHRAQASSDHSPILGGRWMQQLYQPDNRSNTTPQPVYEERSTASHPTTTTKTMDTE